MKKFLGFLLIFGSLISKAADSTFVINGKLYNVKSGKIFLNIYSGNNTVKDSAIIKNGLFKFKGKANDASTAVLYLAGKQTDYFVFYIEPKTFSITGVGDSLKLLSISGSPLNADDKLLKKRLEFITKWEDNNGKMEDEAIKANNMTLMDSLNDVDMEILTAKRKVISQFVKDYPHSMRSAIAITENYAYYAEATDVQPLYDLLDRNLKGSAKGVAIKKMIAVYRNVAIGKTAPDIIQSSPEGKTTSLSSLKGKYVLVDFWASWCGPCRRENPNIVKTYSEFKDKNFAIYGVSYDTKKDKWEKAIKDDGLNWFQVSDLQGWKNATSDAYGIRAIPANFLLDKNGKIIAKNIFGKKLSEKLSELIN